MIVLEKARNQLGKNMLELTDRKKTLILVGMGFLTYLGLFQLNLVDGPLSQFLVHIISVVAAISIAVIAWNTRSLMHDDYLLVLGIGYFFVGLLDLTQLFDIYSFNTFDSASNLPVRHLALFLECTFFIGFQFFIGRKCKPLVKVSLFSGLLFIVVILLRFLEPPVKEQGRNVVFSVLSNNSALVCTLMVFGATLLLFHNRNKISSKVFSFFTFAFLFTVLSEVSFKLKFTGYEFTGLLAGYLKILSYFFIYQVLVESGLLHPFQTLFETSSKNQKDLSKAYRDQLLMSSCIKLVNRADDQTSLLYEICKLIVKEGGYRMACVYLLNHSSPDQFEPAAGFDNEKGYLAFPELTTISDGAMSKPILEAFNSGRSVMNKDYSLGSDIQMMQLGNVSWRVFTSIALPLVIDSTVIGVLSVYTDRSNPVSDNDITLLKQMADETANGLSLLQKSQVEFQFEKSLKESRDHMVLAQEIANLGYWSWDIDSDEVFWSNQFYKIIGLEPTEQSAELELFCRSVHPEDSGLLSNLLTKIRYGLDDRFELEHRIIRPDGEVRTVLTNGRITARNKNKLSSYAIGTTQDITNRKKTDSKMLFQTRLLDAVQQAVVVTDSKDMVTYWNPFAEKLYGYNSSETEGRLLNDLISTYESQNAIESIEAKLEKGYNWAGTFEVRKRSGKKFTAQISISPLKDEKGEIMGRIHISSDISTTNAVIEALDISEERFRKIVETAPTIMIIKDAEGNNVYVSPNCKDITGFNQMELMQNERQGIHESDLKRVEKVFKTALKERTGKRNFEFTGTRKDGTSWNASTSWEPLFSSDNRFVGFVTQTIDITEMKAADENQKASLAEKEILVQEVHHRVRNNLQVIAGLLNLQADSFQNIQLKNIIMDSQNRLRSIAAVHEALYKSDSLVEVGLKSCVSKISDKLKKSLLTEENDIEIDIKLDSLSLHLDQATPLALIINELLSNSLRHAFRDNQPGKVLISGFETENGRLNIIVQDDGRGLPENISLESPSTMGLQLVKLLAENQLDGSASLTVDNGSRFSIAFEIVRDT